MSLVRENKTAAGIQGHPAHKGVHALPLKRVMAGCAILLCFSCARMLGRSVFPPGYNWATMENLGSLRSPDGQYELADGVESGVTGEDSSVRLLYLRSLRTGHSEVVFPYTAEACASWGPDSRHFFVNSPTGGTSGSDCIVFAIGSQVSSFSAAEAIAPQDACATSFLARHRVHISGIDWANSGEIRIHIWSWNDGYSEEETITGVIDVDQRTFSILDRQSGLQPAR